MAKNIVLLFDGTRNQPGMNKDTNILKMYNMLENDPAKQLVFYIKGIATETSKALSFFQLVTGAGIPRNIKRGYRLIVEHYQPGDQIFLYGFSRGAYTARSLAGMLEAVGILHQARTDLINEAFENYSGFKDSKVPKDFKAEHSREGPVHLIGVFDTVESLLAKIIFSTVLTSWGTKMGFHRFHNVKLSSEKTHAFQALALDDARIRTFKPVLWDEENSHRIQQVWFSGSHKDIGGPGLTPGVAEIALKWMLAVSITNGLLVRPASFSNLHPNPTGKLRWTDGTGRRKIDKAYLFHESVRVRTLADPNYSTLKDFNLDELTFVKDPLE